jgi:hypothetical protein
MRWRKMDKPEEKAGPPRLSHGSAQPWRRIALWRFLVFLSVWLKSASSIIILTAKRSSYSKSFSRFSSNKRKTDAPSGQEELLGNDLMQRV